MLVTFAQAVASARRPCCPACSNPLECPVSDPASRQAALVAAAALIGPAVPAVMVVNRPGEAATALTRMADLLLPWLEADEPAPPSTTRAEAAATAS